MKYLLPLLAFLRLSTAIPTPAWSPALGEFYSAVNSHINEARASRVLALPSCDLSKAQQPVAPTPLPSPDPSWKLATVAIGRGVQNYTCSLASADVKPVAIGALANLYNASCLAANYPDILSMLPALALEYALPANPTADFEPSNLPLVGHHYFLSNGTPTFDFTNDVLSNPIGVAKFKKNSNSTAPANAPKGENGAGDGSVPWLFLSGIASTKGNVAGVYRLNTAGGQPPSNCQSSPAVFSVQYAAEYWFYTLS